MDLHDPQPWPMGTSAAPEYCGEAERLSVMASFALDQLEGDAELARIARFAAKLCNAPTAMVSIVEEQRQRFLAGKGIDVTETPRSTSICAHTMLDGDVLEVLDASTDKRFENFSLVTGEAGLRYYCGAPLISSEGAPLGALCVIDYEPRTQPLGELELEGLRVLAEAVKRRLESHRLTLEAGDALKDHSDRLQFVLDSLPDIAWSAAAGPQFDYFNARFNEVTGMSPRRDIDDWRAVIHPDDFPATSKKFAKALSTATPFEDEWRLKTADGSYRYVLSRAVPSSDNPATARWFGTLTDIDDAYRMSKERELVAGELAHRIKNIFSVILGLVSIHSQNDPDHKSFGDMLADNIRALSRAQDFALRIGDQAEDNLHDLLAVLVAPYGTPGNQAVTISGDDAPTGRRSTTPLALVFHELATNSAKYGALSVPEGHVNIAVKREAENLLVTWKETGGPVPTAPEETGFGSRLIRMAISHQLGGSIEHHWQSTGLQVQISLPLERLAA